MNYLINCSLVPKNKSHDLKLVNSFGCWNLTPHIERDLVKWKAQALLGVWIIYLSVIVLLLVGQSSCYSASLLLCVRTGQSFGLCIYISTSFTLPILDFVCCSCFLNFTLIKTVDYKGLHPPYYKWSAILAPMSFLWSIVEFLYNDHPWCAAI